MVWVSSLSVRRKKTQKNFAISPTKDDSTTLPHRLQTSAGLPIVLAAKSFCSFCCCFDFFLVTQLYITRLKKSFEWIRMTEIWSTSQPLNKMLFKLELAKNATPWVDGCKNASSLSRWTLVTRTSGAPPANSPSLGGKATNRGSDNLQHLLFSQYLTLHL